MKACACGATAGSSAAARVARIARPFAGAAHAARRPAAQKRAYRAVTGSVPRRRSHRGRGSSSASTAIPASSSCVRLKRRCRAARDVRAGGPAAGDRTAVPSAAGRRPCRPRPQCERRSQAGPRCALDRRLRRPGSAAPGRCGPARRPRSDRRTQPRPASQTSAGVGIGLPHEVSGRRSGCIRRHGSRSPRAGTPAARIRKTSCRRSARRSRCACRTGSCPPAVVRAGAATGCSGRARRRTAAVPPARAARGGKGLSAIAARGARTHCRAAAPAPAARCARQYLGGRRRCRRAAIADGGRPERRREFAVDGDRGRARLFERPAAVEQRQPALPLGSSAMS